MEALAREPPPAPQGRNAHLRHTRTPSLDQFPSPPSPSSTSFLLQSSPSALALHPSLLPDLPPLSPLGIPYPSLSRSPSVNGSLRSSPSVSPLVSKGKGRANFLSDRLNKATTFSPTSDTSPLLSDGSGLGFYSAGEDPYPTEDSPPRVPKKSLWKAVAFGRNKATARSRSPSTTPNSTRSLPPPPLEHVVRSTSTSSLDALQPSPIPAAVSTKRSDMTLRKKASSIALGLAEEGERLASHVEQAVARRASGAGRGIDQDLDDMDREERSRRSSKQLLGVDESSAVPWRGGERYVHDLVDVDDAGDDSDGEEIKDTPALSVDPAETLYSRRRQLGAEGLALLTISPTMLPLASPLEPPKSAPLLAHHTFASRANPAHLKSETLDVRSWSDGRLDLTAAGDLPGDEELLAASLGLKPNGSAATVIVRRERSSSNCSRLTSSCTGIGITRSPSLIDICDCCDWTEERREEHRDSARTKTADRKTDDDFARRERESRWVLPFNRQHEFSDQLRQQLQRAHHSSTFPESRVRSKSSKSTWRYSSTIKRE